MAARLDSQRLGLVFQSRPDILEGIKAAADSPARITLFNNIASFVHDQLHTNSEPAAKRRRVDDGPAANGAGPRANGADASQEEVLLEIKEISVSAPQRKKFELCFTARHLYARAPGTSGPAQGIVYAWEDIEYAFFLPVPGKAQIQHNYVLFPRGSCLAPLRGTAAADAPEPLVFTIPATAPKQGTIGGRDAAQAAHHSDAYHTLFHWALGTRLRAAGSAAADIVSADPAKFHSAIPQSHRPKEKAVHVGAFRGSKDGFLFFLENGILWGFKKPLLFIPLARVAAVSYTSVLQRTFNMVVEVFTGNGEEADEVEFGMIDQADYEGIDESYVKKNRLQDRSMAERRKAKLELAENREVKKEGEEGAEEGGGVSALEAAQAEDEQRLQDEEDELEEDYDPGSDDDSDGSGTSSEEEDSDEEGEEGDGEDEVEEGDEGEEGEDEEGEGEEEPEDDEMKVEEVKVEEVEVKREKPAGGVAQAGLAAGEDELSGAPYNGHYDDEMDLEETFDVVG